MSYLVGNNAVFVDSLEDPGLRQCRVPLADLVRVGDGLDQQLGRHLNPSLAAVNLATSSIFTTLHKIPLEYLGSMSISAVR